MKSNIKVALVHDYFMQYGGAERVFEAIYELFSDVDVYCPVIDKKIINRIDPKMNIHTSRIFTHKIVKKYYRAFLPLYPFAVEKYDFSNYDLVISDSSAWVKNIITPPRTIHISYIYSPMRFLWNYFYNDINSRPLLQKLLLLPISHFLRMWDFSSTDRSDYIFTISKYVQKRVKKYYKKKSTVIYPYVDWNFYTPSNYKGNYFLLVSRFRPYKKIDLAVKTFSKLGEKLIIVGNESVPKYYKQLAKKNIIFLRDIDDDHLRELYAGCRAFIFPQEEDFGITPLEAQSCGRPVIAYKKGGALETIKSDETGIFFKEQTVNSLMNAIEKFKKMEKSFNKNKIRDWAKNFSKEKFKKNIREKIREILNNNRSERW